MDLNQIKEMASLAAALAIPVASLFHSVYMWKKTGKIDLDKTLQSAGDLVHVIAARVDADPKKDVAKAVADSVGEIESLRGHAISKKLARKGTMHIEAKLRELRPDLFKDAE